MRSHILLPRRQNSINATLLKMDSAQLSPGVLKNLLSLFSFQEQNVCVLTPLTISIHISSPLPQSQYRFIILVSQGDICNFQCWVKLLDIKQSLINSHVKGFISSGCCSISIFAVPQPWKSSSFSMMSSSFIKV